MCVVVWQSPVPPQYVFWYHNSRMINYDAARGVTVQTEPGPKTQSALAIRSAAPRHSGNYTCAAANTEPAHIYVYVSEGSQYPSPHPSTHPRSPTTRPHTDELFLCAGDKMAATLSRSRSGRGAAGGAVLLANLLAALLGVRLGAL